MVIFKGNKRVFDKIIQEDNTSTGQARVISIYGVTAYSDIENVPLQINSTLNGLAQSTINVNNLGAIRIKVVDSAGIMIDVKDGWVAPSQIYTVVYKSGFFILVSQNSDDSNKKETYIITGLDDLVALTSTSTQTDINNVFGGSTADFIDSLLMEDLLIAQDGPNLININYSISFTSLDVLDTVTLEFIYNGYYYKQVYTANSNSELVSVAVIKSSVENPSVTVEDDLTSDSHDNPPSVHAVNQALGAIDTILTNIINS